MQLLNTPVFKIIIVKLQKTVISFIFTYSDSDDLTFEGFADDCSVLEEQQVKTSKANIGVADFDRSANCLNIEIGL